MVKDKLSLRENDAIELMGYILTSAQGLMQEPPKYAVLRMVSIADRMAAMWGPNSSGELQVFLDDLAQNMPLESAKTQGDDFDNFKIYLAEKIVELATIVKDRDMGDQR